ncbi:MAG: NAD-dependent deacylase [Balneola sp.]|nr:MAG: NAD-dependent deacylase [Balneola sp.]
MPVKDIVVLSGAGVSSESGLATFRDSGGLWEGYNVHEVASIDGWNKDPEKVLAFYNLRRKQASQAGPNAAHYFIGRLEKDYEVTVITQNVDDLHERGGSSNVIHLHGELSKARGEFDDSHIIEIGTNDINPGDKAPDGSQLRPAIVWFGEMVPLIEIAAQIVAQADLLIVIGTSLVVYPAASLVNYAKKGIPKFIIDPSTPELFSYADWIHIKQSACAGVEELEQHLIHLRNE